MTPCARRGRKILAVLGAFFLPLAFATDTVDDAFMPKGGRVLLLQMVGPGPDVSALRAIVQTRHTEDEWRAFIDANKNPPVSERERATLAAYLAVNMPVSEEIAKRSGLAAALPADGRELAWNECQSCHSLFSGYLTQSRDAQGWRSVFLSPFHKELKLSQQEREEFARYAAINMPLKVEDVPQDLRF